MASLKQLRTQQGPALLAAAAWALLAACTIGQDLRSGEKLRIGDTRVLVQGPSRSGAVRAVGDREIRFELRPGEFWEQDRAHGSKAERAELSIQRKVRFGASTSAKFSFRFDELDISPGRRHTMLFQLHGPNRGDHEGLEGFGPPPFDIHVRGEWLEFMVRSGSAATGPNPPERIGRVPLEIGVWRDYRIEVRLGDGDKGQVSVWQDGQVVADYHGPVGYDLGSGAHYWKFGAYQYGPRKAKTVLNFRCVSFDDGGYLIGHGTIDDDNRRDRGDEGGHCRR